MSGSPRFNMPFELGLDLGLRVAGKGRLARKQCLILQEKSFQHQIVLSDLSGNDCRAHNSEPEVLVRQVRNWFVDLGHLQLPSATSIWEAYNEFYAAFDEEMKRLRFAEKDIREMPISEFVYFAYLLDEPQDLRVHMAPTSRDLSAQEGGG